MIVYVHTRARSLVSIGYEGKTIVDLLDSLVAQRVEVLVDVRLTPLSRKPGLSKTRLANALASVGIGYVHHRALGNPKDNRDGFRAGDPASIQRYHEVLSGEAAGAAIEHVAELLDGGAVAVDRRDLGGDLGDLTGAAAREDGHGGQCGDCSADGGCPTGTNTDHGKPPAHGQ